jgi:hypothetical protein
MAKRVDKNQAEIVAALRAVPGVTVQDLHTVGKGCPDILVGYYRWPTRLNFLFEIKSPGGKLTGSEPEWHARWRGQVAVVHSAEEALKIMGIID